ncbi:MAG: glycosyltransferase [Bacteroidetes bacterium]|nr:MAG: glycosyltransferase [Bacteroidota bacterium]
MHTPTLLLTAYAVDPYKGSENGMGWQFIRQAAKGYRVIAITRENNLPAIERYLREHDVPEAAHIQWVGYDLPRWARWWKRGNIGAMPYYVLWQRTLPAFIRRQRWSFDLVHNLNFHNDWSPTWLWQLGKPLVWGPIGHHPLIPTPFLRPVYGWKPWLADRGRWLVKQLFWRSPALRRSAQRADLVLAMNHSVAPVLPAQPRWLEVFPSAGSMSPGPLATKTANERFEVLSVGRFVPLKGFDITVRSFAAFRAALPEAERARVRLTLIGKGPSQPLLERLGQELGLGESLRFISWIPHQELLNLYREADLFFFPSHEGAGMVVPEALSYGLPVLSLDNCGPGEFITPTCGRSVPYGPYDETVAAFAARLSELYSDPALRETLSAGARDRFDQWFDWDTKGALLRQWYHSLLPVEEPLFSIPN